LGVADPPEDRTAGNGFEDASDRNRDDDRTNPYSEAWTGKA
jgi:hypothetical protein